MPARQRYRFLIDEAFSPDTLPMARLAEYMGDLATLLGEKPSVHFIAVEGGSAVLVHEVDWEAVPKVRSRVRSVRHHEGPPDALRAYQSLNRKLAEDNAFGRLVEEATDEQPNPVRLLEFPGRGKRAQLEYGPFGQPGELHGVVIVIGGESDPVPVHLQDGTVVHICRARRSLARQLAQHLFTTPLRVTGMGRWFRDSDAHWLMKSFTITGFVELDDKSLAEVVSGLRRIPADWKQLDDPIRELGRIRKGEGESA